MASRSKKAGSVAPTQHQSSATLSTSTTTSTSTTSASVSAAAAAAGAEQRPTSPLSPTRHSRLVEKVELQNLNDRLACYIDRVRFLENENARLTVEIQTSRDTVTRETSNIKQMYEHELHDARKLLDETAREKAKLEIDAKRLWEEVDDLKQRLEKKTKEHAQAEAAARMYETRAMDLANKYNTSCADRKKLSDEAAQSAALIEKLRRQLDDLRKQLEAETLARVDLENTVQSLREELTFKDSVHSQELSETRTRRQVEISEIDGRLAEQYEARLQQSLQELRDQYEHQMRTNRDEIEALYDGKLKTLQNAAQRSQRATTSVSEELRTVRSRIDGLNKRIEELEGANAGLQARIRELEHLLDNERSRRAEDEAELARLREEMALQLQEYQDLMDIKVSLDLEIAAYDKLLCGEEQRLNITPANGASASHATQSFVRNGSSNGRSSTPSAALQRRPPSRASVGSTGGGGSSHLAVKRKRTIVEETEERQLSDFSITASAKGDVEIVDVCGAGRFVKLGNKSRREIAIGGWQLLRYAGGANETAFKFHRSVRLEPGQTICVWSDDVAGGVPAEGTPGNIVMKQQKWFVADNMRTVLLNGDAEEVAASERVRHLVSSHASRHREAYGGADGAASSTAANEQLQRQDRAGSTGSSVGRLFSFWSN